MDDRKSGVNFKKIIIWGIIFAAISFTLGPFLSFLADKNFSFENANIDFKNFDIDMIVNAVQAGFATEGLWMFTGVVFATLCAFPLLNATNHSKHRTPRSLLGKNYDTQSDKKGAARWLSKPEIARIFPRYTYATANKYKVNGFVVQVMETKKATYANLKGDVHCLIIGTTGSGKTIRFVTPTMQFLARSALRPSLVVTDPKAELYYNNSLLYQERGYEIIVLNLRDPLKESNYWNPCYTAWSEYQEGLKQKEKIKFHYDSLSDYQKNKKLKLVNRPNEYFEEWYEFNNYAFANLKDAVVEAERQENSWKARAMESINDLIGTIYAESEKKAQDPFWVKSAKGLVEGLLIAMLEDSEIEELGLTEQSFNLANVLSTLSLRVDQLKSYFAIRNVNSFAKRKAQGSIDAPQSGTQQSIISTALADLTSFSDPDIQFITCNNDIDFKDIGRKPTVVFLVVPDEKENRHIFASLFITQAYKSLVELASEKGGKLPHPVNFIIDEFANLPVIPGMENKITVARSRGMSFMLIIQALSQLRAKYGPDVAEIIRTNCNLQIFLATNDNETAEYFSKICGEKTIRDENVSQDMDGKENISSSLSSRPLIRPEELLTLPEGISVVKFLRTQPAKLHQMAYWKSRSYYVGERKFEESWNPHLFSFEEDGYYDIANRSRSDAEYLQKPLEIYDPELIKQERERDKLAGLADGESAGGEGFSGEGEGVSLFEEKEFSLETEGLTKETQQSGLGMDFSLKSRQTDFEEPSITNLSLDDDLLKGTFKDFSVPYESSQDHNIGDSNNQSNLGSVDTSDLFKETGFDNRRGEDNYDSRTTKREKKDIG